MNPYYFVKQISKLTMDLKVHKVGLLGAGGCRGGGDGVGGRGYGRKSLV